MSSVKDHINYKGYKGLVNDQTHTQMLSVVHSGAGKFNFGILVAGNLDFLRVAYLLESDRGQRLLSERLQAS